VADYYASAGKCRRTKCLASRFHDEEFSRENIRKVGKTLAKALEAQKFWHIPRMLFAHTNQAARLEAKSRNKIRYAVLCYGVPLRITRIDSQKEAGNAAPELPNVAAVDSELAAADVDRSCPAERGNRCLPHE